ncbi:MAG: glycosyltransferase family 4 protein, partial [Desulfobacterales bacterium]
MRNHAVKSGDRPRIGVFVSFSGTGGVERMVLNLCEGLAARGCRVDLLQVKAHSQHLEQLPSMVHIRKLNAEHTLSSLPALVRYLKTERPDALLAAKDRANQV